MNSLTLDDDLITTIIDISKSENKQYNQFIRELVNNYLKESNNEFKINEQACLDALTKIKQGDKSTITPISNINDYIKNLRNEIS